VATAFLVLACSALLQLAFIWKVRQHIQMSRLWPFLVGGALGIPLGFRLLAETDTNVLKLALGAFLLIYGLYALAAPRLPYISGGGRLADAAIGFGAGILGGLGGYSGVLPTIWTQLRGWPKDMARGVFQPFILAAQIVTLALVGFVAVDRQSLILFAITLPALVLGGWIGWLIYGKLDDRRFRQAIGALLVLSGAALVF